MRHQEGRVLERYAFEAAQWCNHDWQKNHVRIPIASDKMEKGVVSNMCKLSWVGAYATTGDPLVACSDCWRFAA